MKLNISSKVAAAILRFPVNQPDILPPLLQIKNRLPTKVSCEQLNPQCLDGFHLELRGNI
jgi:hypothetical protein